MLEVANSGKTIDELKKIYDLTEEEIEQMEKMAVEKQYNIITFGD